MKRKLEVYEAKRHFESTPEPPARAARGAKKTEAPRAARAREKAPRDGAASFVIQRHDARRLHYDFRLELDGTLKSWAVPKEPSLDPSVKRLAVHVEDHPLAYGNFEGRIPEGNYGAGTVEIWDRGTWRPEGGLRAARDAYAHGKLNFSLDGERLHGNWTLVRSSRSQSKQEQWFLIKRRDDEAAAAAPAPTPATAKRKASGRAAAVRLEGAVKAALPAQFSPQLATPAARAPGLDNWLYEVKFDGYRVLARIERRARGKPDVRIFTRAGLDWTEKFPRQAEALARLDVRSAWLDGEAVVLDEQGIPDFQALQNAFNGDGHEIVLWLFDLPWLDGMDLRQVALEARRARLAEVLQGAPAEVLRFSEAFEGDPDALLQASCAAGLEGLVAKRRDSHYVSARSGDWLKLRCSQRQEFVIGGFSEPSGGRSGFGALLIGTWDDGALRYAGRVGTGFDTAQLDSLARELKARERKTSPFASIPAGERRTAVHWVEPELVAEVRFKTWTGAGVVRQASFVGLRRDKPADAVVREPQSPAVKVPRKAAQAAAAKATTKGGASGQASSSAGHARHGARGDTEVAGQRVSNPSRVIDETTGLRKIDLVRYFESIAPWMLPHLGKRPVSIVRAPKGIAGEKFFQKHANALQIPFVVQHEGLDTDRAPLMTLESPESLVGAGQMDTVEIHTWNALVTNIEKPDRIVFDLDPDPALDWSRMLEAARLTHDLLDELGLRSWCKTSGGKGLHVVVPLARHSGWDEVRDFARAVAEHMTAMLPERFSAKMGERNRKGRIFVDYLRNGRGASTVAAYSPRARPGLGVSVPLRWGELDSVTGGAQWTVANLHERLDKLHGDPWEGYAQTRQRLTAAIRKRLERS